MATVEWALSAMQWRVVMGGRGSGAASVYSLRYVLNLQAAAYFGLRVHTSWGISPSAFICSNC